MVTRARGRRRVLTLALALASAACGARGAAVGASSAAFGAGGRVGLADAGGGEREATGDGVGAVVDGWPATFARATASVASQGHGAGRWDVEVYLSATARTVYEGGAERTYPDGSAFVALHRERNGAPGPSYAMQKRGGGWRFVALDAHGRVLLDAVSPDAGPGGPCAACHREAPRDGVFAVVP